MASWSFATHSGSLRDAVDGRSAASTWSASALISSTLTSAMGDPRSAVMSLHGDVWGSGAGGGALVDQPPDYCQGENAVKLLRVFAGSVWKRARQ